MTEKEKAKAYDEAIERAKKLYGNGIIEEIFPELKESKDKKIREAILKGLIDCRDAPDLGWSNFGGIHIDDCIAWLEKQGETSPILSNSLNTGKNEQKTADKVEPKFKVGDWIISSVLGTARIIGVNDSNEFQLEYTDGKQEFSSIDYVNYAYDKWTIENAKDGNVLALSWLEDKNLWEKIIIFKKYHSEGVKGICSMPCVEGYGNTFKNGKMAFTDEEVPYYSKTWTWNLHPATKEQRDLLFQKIKEAGYEWDVDNKELKKLDLVPNKKPILGGLNMKTYNDINIGDTVYIWGTSDSSVDETTITEKYDDRGHWNLKFSNGCVGRALKNGTSSTMGMYACLVYSDKEAVRESINERIKILSNIKI